LGARISCASTGSPGGEVVGADLPILRQTFQTLGVIRRMSNIKEMQAKRDSYVSTARSILDRADSENRDLTDSERKDYENVLQKARGVSGTLDRAAQLNGLRADLSRPVAAGVPLNASRTPLMFGNVRAYRSDERIADAYSGPSLDEFVRATVMGESRAMGENIGTLGGFLVPTQLAGFIIDLARAQSVVVNSGALTVVMESGALDIPRLLTDPVASWRNENDPIAEGDPTFGSAQLTARSLACLVSIPNELLLDSPVVGNFVTSAITKAMAVAMDTGALMGTGTQNQPLGIINRQNVGTYSMGANGAVLADWSTFVKVAGQIAGANGPIDGLSYILSSRDYTTTENLQDTLHQPLRQPNVVARMKPYTTSKIPTNLTQGTANNASFGVCGDMSQVILGIRQAFTLEVSREAGAAFQNNQTLIRAILRMEVSLQQPKWIVAIQGITQ
jgi:HK97 family phage major capsid protein